MKFFKNLAGLNTAMEIETNNESEKVDKNNIISNKLQPDEDNDAWLDEDYEEGQLAIDVYQTDKEIVVKSTIAGVKPEDIDVSINNDMLTIRGIRKVEEKIDEENYFYQECYWGSFSRSIILPVEVKAEEIDATLDNGVLTVKLPKKNTNKQISIKVKD